MNHPASLLFPLLLAACVGAQDPAVEPAQAARRTSLHAAGVKAPLLLMPVRLLGRTDPNVTEVLGLLLEQRGMHDLQVASTAFDAKDTAWDAVPAALAAHLRTRGGAAEPAAARHALYAEFLGDPKRGPTEVRFVVVDAQGELVLADRQKPADAAFRRTAGRDPDPLGCSQLVVERLFELADWQPVAGGVPNGPFAARWQRKSGMPDATERAAMQQRLTALRAKLAEASFAVFAPVWPEGNEVDAARFAQTLQVELGCKAVAPIAGAALTVPPGSNQQKRLFDLAAAAKAALGKQAITADYAIAAELGFSKDGKHGLANVVVLTKAGELVLADFLNDQHELFARRAPKNLVDGEQLVAAQLRQSLR